MYLQAMKKEDPGPRRRPNLKKRPTREDLLRTMPYLRNLFRLHNFDVAPYADETIVDAVLQVCPTVTGSWPTAEQLAAVFRYLSGSWQ